MTEAEASEDNILLYQRGGEGEESGQDAWDDTALIKAYDEAVSVVKAKLAEQNPEFSPLMPKSKKKPKKKKKKKNSFGGWAVGDTCRAVYTEDGEVYTARIISLDSNDTCTLEYLGYGNRESQQLAHLMPAPSQPSSLRTDTASEVESINPETFIPKESHKEKSKRNRPVSKNKSKPDKQNNPLFPWGNQHPHPPPWGQMPPPTAFHPFQPSSFPTYPPTGPAGAPMFPSIPPPPPLFSQTTPGIENEAMYSMLISWYMSGYHTGYYQGLQQSSSGSGAGASAHR